MIPTMWMAARQDDALELAIGGKLAHPVTAHVTRMNFAVHMGLAHTACDELGNLGAKVKDKNFVVLHGGATEAKK